MCLWLCIIIINTSTTLFFHVLLVIKFYLHFFIKFNLVLFEGFSKQFWVLSRNKWDNEENKLDNDIIKTNLKQLTSNCG